MTGFKQTAHPTLGRASSAADRLWKRVLAIHQLVRFILPLAAVMTALGFAVVPLVRFTTDRGKMGDLVAPRWVAVLAWVVAAVIICLNMKLLYDFAFGT